jgi:hypothetical protein
MTQFSDLYLRNFMEISGSLKCRRDSWIADRGSREIIHGRGRDDPQQHPQA